MGIYKVEIFCPRRVRIVSVQKQGSRVQTPRGQGQGQGTATGGTPTPQRTPQRTPQGSFRIPSDAFEPGPLDAAPPGPAAGSLVRNASVLSGAVVSEDTTGHSPSNTKTRPPEEVIVMSKEHVDQTTGEVSVVDVTYAVTQIRREDDDAKDDTKGQGVDENGQTAEDGSAGPGGASPSNMTQKADPASAGNGKGNDVPQLLRTMSDPTFNSASTGGGGGEGGGVVVRVVSPDLSAVQGNGNGNGNGGDLVGATVPAPASQEVVEDDVEINVEGELRDLLLNVLPGVRVTWNRCNSLMQSDDLDNMSVSFLEVACYCKRRTAMHVASRILDEIGIGKDFGRLAVFPVEFFRPMLQNYVNKARENDTTREQMTTDVAAMLQFDELLDGVDRGAQLTFDFIAFLIIAAIIAGAGLGANSAVSTVASMLVSPMMGPILATVLGTVLVAKGDSSSTRNREVAMRLIRQGFLAEGLCLITCVLIGICVGLGFYSDREHYGWGDEGNSEMLSRTSTRGLVVGIVVAIPSGAGVALSLLGKNGNSLVGVAISASLLPPAVNCGMYMAFAMMEDSSDLAEKGAISMALTCVNVVCIYVSALGTLYLKRALPQRDFDGRPINPLFGVSNFDLAATGAIRGKNVEQTDIAKDRLALLGLARGRTPRGPRGARSMLDLASAGTDGVPQLRRVNTTSLFRHYDAASTVPNEPFPNAQSYDEFGGLASTWHGGGIPRIGTGLLFDIDTSSDDDDGPVGDGNAAQPRAAFDDMMVPSTTGASFAVPVLRRRTRRGSH